MIEFLKKNKLRLIIILGMVIYAVGAMLSGSFSPEQGMQYIVQALISLFAGSELPPPA